MAGAKKYIKIDGIKASVLWVTNRLAGPSGTTFERIQERVGASPVIAAIAELVEAGMLEHPLDGRGEPIVTKFLATDHGITCLRRSYKIAIEAIDAQMRRVGEVGHPRSEVERLERQRQHVEEARAVLKPIEDIPLEEQEAEPPRVISRTETVPASEMPPGPSPQNPLTEGLMSGKGPTRRAASVGSGKD